jgi:hypothetical protein
VPVLGSSVPYADRRISGKRDGGRCTEEPQCEEQCAYALVGVPALSICLPSFGWVVWVPGEGAFVDVVRVKAIMITAAPAARTQSSCAGPAGASTAARMIKAEVSGSRTGVTRPKVPSMPCCILICGVSSRRAGCSSAQDADSARPASRRAAALR